MAHYSWQGIQSFPGAFHQLSCIMRKPVFCICENKGADQLCGNSAADQCLCFCYKDSTIPKLHKPEISNIFCGCTARFLSDLVRKPEERFSRDAAQLSKNMLHYSYIHKFYLTFINLVNHLYNKLKQFICSKHDLSNQ